MQILSNQPNKGETYYGVRIYVKGKYYGSYNGITKTKRIQYFIKDFFDMWFAELQEKTKNNKDIELKIVTKTY
jgi:hypothetical protein